MLIGLGLACVGAAQAATTSWVPTATQGITLTNFTVQATRLGPVAGNRKMHIIVGLRVQNEAQLNSAVLAVNTPGNPSVRQVPDAVAVRCDLCAERRADPGGEVVFGSGGVY